MPASPVSSLTTALGVCCAILMAACGGDHATAPLAAENPPTAPAASPSTYDIQVRFVGDGATPRVREAVRRATVRWGQVIVGDIGTTALNAAAGECRPWMPAIRETVPDLVVYVRTTAIDGENRIVAQASPCYVNADSRLPIVGFLELDTDDMDALEQRGLLDEVVLHEIGHVLGLGTLWNYRRALLVGGGTDDPYFGGPGARAAFLAAGGAQYGGTPVPVENTGNPGTRDTHWRASIFGNELMQGFAQAGGMPLSAVTIASLGDLGYTVALSAADHFTAFAALRAAPQSDRQSERLSLSGDVATSTLFEVDRTGASRRLARN